MDELTQANSINSTDTFWILQSWVDKYIERQALPFYTETETDTFLSWKSDIWHTHDDRYYTETETDGLLAWKSDTWHTHDDRYYTESEVDALIPVPKIFKILNLTRDIANASWTVTYAHTLWVVPESAIIYFWFTWVSVDWATGSWFWDWTNQVSTVYHGNAWGTYSTSFGIYAENWTSYTTWTINNPTSTDIDITRTKTWTPTWTWNATLVLFW